MGSDIHGWIEIKHKGEFVAVKELYCRDRNYQRFAKLAGVRDYWDGNVKPKGIPKDVSQTTKYWIEQWGADGHSHSYLDLKTASRIFLDTDNPEIQKKNIDWPFYHYFRLDEEDYNSEMRLVFWFDN